MTSRLLVTFVARSAYNTSAAVKYAYRRGKSSAAVRAQPRPLPRVGAVAVGRAPGSFVFGGFPHQAETSRRGRVPAGFVGSRKRTGSHRSTGFFAVNCKFPWCVDQGSVPGRPTARSFMWLGRNAGLELCRSRAPAAPSPAPTLTYGWLLGAPAPALTWHRTRLASVGAVYPDRRVRPIPYRQHGGGQR